MGFFSRDHRRRQVAWSCGFNGENWYAHNDSEISDPHIIRDAQIIVDACRPQKFGPMGAHAYSFITREYLLNLLLFHYQDHGAFPEGSLCIVDEWVWKNSTQMGNSHWFMWRTKHNGRHYERPFWIHIPKLSQARLIIKPNGDAK